MTTRLQREDGMAVIVALMAMMLMTALGLSLGDRDGLEDQRLRDGPPGLQDGPPALGLADALQPGRGASALPFPGGSSHGG